MEGHEKRLWANKPHQKERLTVQQDLKNKRDIAVLP